MHTPLDRIQDPGMRRFAEASALGLGAYALSTRGQPARNGVETVAGAAGAVVNAWILLHVLGFLAIVWTVFTLLVGAHFQPHHHLFDGRPVTSGSIAAMSVLQAVPVG